VFFVNIELTADLNMSVNAVVKRALERSFSGLPHSPQQSNQKPKVGPDINRKVSEARGMEIDCASDMNMVEENIKGAINEVVDSAISRALKSVTADGKDGKMDKKTMEMAKSVLHYLKGTLNECISDAICNAISNIMIQLNQSRNDCQRQVLIAKYERDEQEQYTRREAIRVSGLKEDEGEDLNQKIIQLVDKIGVKIRLEDISVCHRIGRPNTAMPRQVLCRFISKRTRDEILVNKMKLKDIEETKKKIFIDEDLTPLRYRCLRAAKDRGRCHTINGKIICQIAGEERRQVIQSPDDLFKLGIDQIDYKALGLGRYLLSD
jgi:hypothetical protein